MYLYKFLGTKDEVLYIGKTNNLKHRFNSHKQDKYWWNEIKKIEFTQINNFLVDIYERFYINYYKAKYNVKDSNMKYKEFNLKLLKWSEFND
jgi:excinuclease UvrABC nuclease subunit